MQHDIQHGCYLSRNGGLRPGLLCSMLVWSVSDMKKGGQTGRLFMEIAGLEPVTLYTSSRCSPS